MIPLALGLIGKVAAAAVLPRMVKAVCDLVRGADNHRDSARERCTGEPSIRNNPVNFVDPDGLDFTQRDPENRSKTTSALNQLRRFPELRSLVGNFAELGYTVKYGKDDAAVGLTNHREKTIWIDSDLEGSVPMVLLHEILHALNRHRDKCPSDPVPEEFRKLGDQAVHAWIYKFQGEILEKFNPPNWNGHDDVVMAHPYNIRKAFKKGGLKEALKYMNQNKIPDHL